MQNKTRGRQLTVLFENSWPKFDLENNIGDNLNKRSAKSTFNAWTKGALVDGTGKVWINEEYLSQIWRTTASYFVDGIAPTDKANFGGIICINYSAVIYRLNEIIDSPFPDKRRDYLRLSENMGKSVRDSECAEVIRLKYSEHIMVLKRELKRTRIKEFNIISDELTGIKLMVTTSEFHHIRRQSVYPYLVNIIWNGLIVNKETHKIITANNINDEYDLRDLCDEMGWSKRWFSDYEEALNKAGVQ